MLKSYKFYFLVCTILCFNLSGTAQLYINGTVLHAETGAPVPYAYVKKKNTNRGAITNEDGYFEMECSKSDTLVISFVSFQKQEVPAIYFLSEKTCLLKPSLNELATVEVYADFEFLYDLFDRARKNLKQVDEQQSKAYFSLETATRNIPIELLECYYNGKTDGAGIKTLGLKNGRIGMSKLDNTYYASLHTTKVVSDYHLLNKRDNKLPSNPLQLSKKRMKKHYKMRLLAFQDGTYKLKFTPKHNINQYFTALVWIDKSTTQIVQVELSQKNVKKHPFIEIDQNHNLDSLDFSIAYTFSTGKEPALDKVAFNYSLDYDNRLNTRRIETNGIFLFFEQNAAFDLPHFSETEEDWSDYDKIVLQPYNELFWKNNMVISPSKKAMYYRDYFKENGVLLNYDELSKYNDLFKRRLVEWSPKRLLIEEINDEGNYYVARENDYHNAQMIGDFYDLFAHIYLDRNEVGDSVYYLSSTLIDLEDSYYYLEPNKNTSCIVNTYFDLVELERRHLMEVLESQYWTNQQVDSIYTKSQSWLKDNLKYYLSDVDHGENSLAVAKYVRVVKNHLGVDNSLLIWSDFMITKMKESRGEHLPWVQLYNYGTALLQIGKYKESLPVLLQAYELNNEDPWLLYNIGLNYIKLGNMEEGCDFLAKSQRMGEEVPKELISECE